MPKLRVERLDHQESLRDRALAILRQAIVSGEIEAGGLYSATALAHELGISVSPVREAMLTLVTEGIMEPVRNRGFRIRTVSEQGLAEIVELRTLLEVPVVAALAERDLSPWWDDLLRQVSDLEEAAAASDLTRFLERDREFHLGLLEIGGNQRLVDMVATLRDQTRLYGLSHLATEGRLAEAAWEHREILTSLGDGDAPRARTLMTEHLGHILHEWSDGTSAEDES